MRRLITTPYKKGYDEIKVNFGDTSQLEQVRETASSLMMGFEIIQIGKNYCVLKNVAEGLISEFDNLYNRLFHILISMLDDIEDAIKKKDKQELQSIIAKEIISNKLSEFCIRLLNKGCRGDLSKTTGDYVIISILEQLTDDLRYFCHFISETEKWPSNKVLLEYKRLKELTKLTYKAFQKKEQHLLIELKKTRNKVVMDMGDYTKKLKDHELVLLNLMFSFLNKLDHLSYEIYPEKK